MDKNMGINNHVFKNSNNNCVKDLPINIYNKKNKKREILINSFIKKFPKVKLDTIISVNKYYKENYEMEYYEKKVINENQIIKSENELLKSKVAVLEEELDLKKYKESSVSGIPAEVLTRSNTNPFGKIIVSVGEEEGVLLGEEVFAGYSPIGKVTFVDKSLSEITLFTSPASVFEAKLEDGTPIELEGKGNNGFLIEAGRAVTAYPGMKIFKASDELYPIAEVVHISFDPRDPTQTIYAKPIVNIESLRFVTIKK